ncbi:hypothetical protein [Propionibacterium australiense]|uniref:Uncharacterized protein n=1 Tax=Propionibacterium australiense TaxID=119981 RepID=A0A8B3FLB2_9ACTN|nr:hypothetical protein [Propionibacterium australiense]RLP12248.1 hypothetical protein D7U36_03030 [Propionibacterium australiense]
MTTKITISFTEGKISIRRLQRHLTLLEYAGAKQVDIDLYLEDGHIELTSEVEEGEEPQHEGTES